jgi:hypothetical protein
VSAFECFVIFALLNIGQRRISALRLTRGPEAVLFVDLASVPFLVAGVWKVWT